MREGQVGCGAGLPISGYLFAGFGWKDSFLEEIGRAHV